MEDLFWILSDLAAWANSPADAHRAAAPALAGGESQPSIVGAFAYTSGPAYGVLLDDLLPAWRRQVHGTSDLGDLLASATKRPPTTHVAAAAARYDAATLRTAEEARDRRGRSASPSCVDALLMGPRCRCLPGAARPATPLAP